jgi:hypothetical protein
MKIDTTIFFFACSETIDSFSFSGSSNFSISPEGVIPRSFLSQDSFKVTYKPNGNSFDTSYLTLHFKGSTKGFDTVVKFIGESTLPSSSFLPHLNGFNSNKEILLVPGYDTTIAFSVSNDILSVDSFDSLTFELNFNSEMLHFDSAITPNAWKTSIDEVLPGLLRCTFNNAPHIDILENQPLAFFHFSSYLSIVSLKAGNAFFDPARKNGCPIESMGQGDSVKIIAVDICSDNNIRNFMIDGKLPEFSIRPNPAENSLTVASSIDLSEASCSVFDQLGRSILRRNVLDFTKDNKVTLDVSGLSSGMYFLRVEANGFSRSQKVVITH